MGFKLMLATAKMSKIAPFVFFWSEITVIISSPDFRRFNVRKALVLQSYCCKQLSDEKLNYWGLTIIDPLCSSAL